jgi:hydroxyacylglutathione hydrolase
VDVRGRTEWEEGHPPGATNVPLGYLAERLGELPADRLIIVQCRSGSRSAIAASVLEAHGRTDVANLSGGWIAWQQAGLATERAGAAQPAHESDVLAAV